MTNFKLSRRALMGVAASIVVGGIPETAMGTAVAATPTDSENLAAGEAVLQDLRCEYLFNPLGIDEKSPRLSWTVQSDQRGWKQSAYEILVASSRERLESGQGDLWSSGKMLSDATTHIEYAGSPLNARQTCFWRARSYDATGAASPWSEPAQWEMGLLDEKDWKSSAWIGRPVKPADAVDNLNGVSWIWFAEPGVNPAVRAPVGLRWFRRTFTVPAGHKCVSAQLLFTVDDGYDVRVNGKQIAKSNVDDWKSTKVRDVTSNIASGENVVAIVGENKGDAAGVACRLIVRFDQGDPLQIDSGAGWKSYRDEVPGWDAVTFDDSAWPDAQVVAAMGARPWGALSPPIEPMEKADPAPYLRKEFVSSGTIQRARLYACGLGYADIYLNGERLGGDSERDTAYTAFDKRILYTTYNVTSLVAQGGNAIAAVLGKGWYDVHDLAVWNFERASWRSHQKLRLLLEIDYADGSSATIASDPTWKLSTGPIVRDGIYSGEIYDARLEMPGWNKPGFADTAWEPVAIVDAPAGKLKARSCPPIAVTATLEPVRVTEPKPGVHVVDFGQNFSGHVQLRVTATAGTRITMRYGELLGADGTLDTSNINGLMAKTDPPQIFQSDTYICKGGGREEIWEQRFSYSGLQFAEVTGFPGVPDKSNFAGRFAHTALESAGTFSCSDEIVNKLQEATRWSYLSNAQSIPTDCPTREKNGWTGDAQLASETGLMNFRSAAFYTKWLDDFADNQKPDGTVGVIVPSGGWGLDACHPAWDSAYPIVAWDLYRYAGDSRILARHFDNMARYVDYLAGRLKDDVIPFGSLGDWVPWKTQTPSELTSTAYLYHDARILADAATVLGRHADVDKYFALASRVKAGFNAKWFNATTRMYSVGEQTAQAIALHLGLTTPKTTDDAFAALVADIQRQGHIDCGILGAKYVVRVLSDGGRADLAYQIVMRREQPSWAWWITQGATTLWEQWTASDSHNHIMFGDISNWFFQSLAGIGLDPESPGFANVLIRPQVVGNLTWAKGTHVGPCSEISSSWSISDGKFRLEVTIPANTSATVWVPTTDASKVTEGGRPAAGSKSVAFLRQDPGAAVYSVGSGTYVFTA